MTAWSSTTRDSTQRGSEGSGVEGLRRRSSAPRPAPRAWLAAAAVAALVAAAPGAAQDAPPEPARVERVYVPEEAFDRVVERHPRGVVVRDAELAELLRRAGLRPAPLPPPPPPPVAATIRHVRLSGAVKDGVATLTFDADVSVLAAGDVALGLPLRGLGLRRVSVDGGPARVLPDADGSLKVLLAGATPDGPVARRVSWEVGVRVEPGEERGAGVLTVSVPAAASGKLDLLVPGDVEVVLPALAPSPSAPTGPQQGQQNAAPQQQAQQAPRRSAPPPEDAAFVSRGCVAWARGVEGGATRVEGAFGGRAGGRASSLVLSWRPRRSVTEVTPYVVVEERSLLWVRQGLVSLEAAAALDVYRADRDRFTLDLPPGFVVRELEVTGEEVTHVQRGDRVEVTLGGSRTGRFNLRLLAELNTGDPEQRQAFAVRPLGFPDADRVAGLLGVGQGEGTVVAFEDVQGLERADAGDVSTRQVQQGDVLLRVYRRGSAPAGLELAATPQAPRVDLVMRSVIGLGERDVRALSIFQFRVERGRVFRLSADVPGFAVETVQVRLVQGNRAVEPPHKLTTEEGRVLVELQQALRGGQELFLNVQAVREEPQGLAGRAVAVPRIGGAPATTFRGHIGFAPDLAYRLTGSDLVGLTAIPAAELPRAGLDVSGLVLGYRIDAPEYAGQVHLTQRETRLSTQLTTQHRVQERVVDTDALLEVEVEGAPVATLELALPAGIGRLVRIEAPDLKDDRELLGPTADGRERWRLTFDERKQGLVPLRVRFSTVLGAEDPAAPVELPKVSVAGAFRERGTVAVFSSDATELQAQAEDLRAIEVTDVAPLADSDVTGRPLFAYTHTGGDHRLSITVKRRDAAPVLSAIVQQVDLRTSAAPDGLSRHVATFRVRHLETQFFALRLPQGATLWSVVVAGQGVKPAEKDGLKIIPMPTTGERREVDEVSVTYTLREAPWGLTTRAGLAAPELLVHGDPVPVLKTAWTVALPDDYRVLEFDGNLSGASATAVRPIALGIGAGAEHAGIALGLLVVALGLASSQRARGWVASQLGRSGTTSRGLGHGLVAFVRTRNAQMGCAMAVLLCVVGFCVVTLMRGCSAKMAPGYEAEHVARSAPARGRDRREAKELAGSGGGGAPMPMTDEGPPFTSEPMPMSDPVAAPPAPPAASAVPEDAPEERRADTRTRGRAAGAEGGRPPARPQAPGAREEQRGRDAEKAESVDDQLTQGFDGAEGEEHDEPVPQSTAPASPPALKPPAPAQQNAAGPGGPADGDEDAAKDIEQKLAAGQVDTLTTAEYALSREKAQELSAVAAFAPELGRVGLRSLVLALPDVGRLASFERPGGQARLGVQVVQTDALTLLAGALAALGLVVGLTLPILRPGLSYLGLLLVSGALLTALPYVLHDARFTTLLNALLLGLLLAGPVHAVRGLAALATAATRSVTAPGAPRDDAMRALAVLDGVLAAVCLALALVALLAGGTAFGVAFLGLTGLAMLVGCVGLAQETRWALVPTLVVGLGQALFVAIGLQDSIGRSGRGVEVAIGSLWLLGFGLAGLGALALLVNRATLMRGAAVLLVAVALFGGSAGEARAQDAQPRSQSQPPRVFIPYDPANPDAKRGEVYVPEDVYLELWRRAYPERVSAPAAAPPASYALGQVTYEGAIDAKGNLTLTANVLVELLAEGPQRCALGLKGCGLREARVQGGKPGGRVRVAPAGELELVAEGPGAYTLGLDLVVPPMREGGYVFAAVPTATATLRVRSAVKDRKVNVDGARAQVLEDAGDGTTTVDASLGDAPVVKLTLAGREVLSAGSSEAAAQTHAVVWARRGRAVLLARTTFDVTGAGREGFLFDVPAGFEVMSVQTEGLRTWRLDEQGRLEVALRRPTGRKAVVLITGELPLAPDATRFVAPQVVPTGVNRESGVLALCTEEGVRARPIGPAAGSGLSQVSAARPVQELADLLRAGAVEKAYEFQRRPVRLELDLTREPVEVETATQVRAIVHPDRMLLLAELAYDVRRGKVHEVAVAVPAGFELTQAPSGLQVREAWAVSEEGGVRTYRFGLATGLAGQGRLALAFERRLDLGASGGAVPFPDLRAVGVANDTTAIAIGVAQGLRLRPRQEPSGLQPSDVRLATRGTPAPAGVEWALAYGRSSGRVPGLGGGVLTVTRPTPVVEGSWTLHARVERDVVRYTLRSVYRISEAGATQFHLLLPQDVLERVTVDAANQREVRTGPAEGGLGRLTVELQSPAEEVYELGASWEQVLVPGQPFAMPQVGLADVVRQARRFILVETAPDVPDKLEQVALSGIASKARASEAPVLPGPASDFTHAYRLDGEGPWSVEFKLQPRDVRLPPAARVPWVELTSVFTTEGVVRHRARYRVHNLRLQFLRLQLPPQAEVWSVFVARAPKRLHHEQGLTLIPLPKGTDADLSFDVELVYATPTAGSFGFGGALKVDAPALRVDGVKVERTHWTVFVPSEYSASGFAGLAESTRSRSDVKALAEEVNELKKLVDLAENSSGSTREVAGSNLGLQLRRAEQQYQNALAMQGKTGAADGLDREELRKNKAELDKLVGALNERENRQAQTQQAQGPQGGAQVEIEGKKFNRLDSGWYTNEEVTGRDAKTRWSGLKNDEAGQQAQQGGQTPGADSWTLSIPEGQSLSLNNAEVFQGRYKEAEELASQRAQNLAGGKRLMDNRGYEEALGESQQQKQQEEQIVEQTRQLRGGYRGQGGQQQAQGGVGDDPAAIGALRTVDSSQSLFRGTDMGGDGTLDYDNMAELEGTHLIDGVLASGTVQGYSFGHGRTEGLLSIEVPFETPGRAYEFGAEGAEALTLSFSVYPEGTGEQAKRVGRGLVLLVLLLGVFRLGLLAHAPGKGALQALGLLVAAALAAASFAHVAGAVVALGAGLWGLRRGSLFAPPAAPAAPPA